MGVGGLLGVCGSVRVCYSVLFVTFPFQLQNNYENVMRIFSLVSHSHAQTSQKADSERNCSSARRFQICTNTKVHDKK